MSELSETSLPSLGFRYLGPLEVQADGRRLRIGSPRQRVVLAMLLLASDCVVSVDHLVDAVWGGSPPATGRTQVAICIAALRKMFAAAGYHDVIATVSPGYKLVSDGCGIDGVQFSRLVDEGQTALQQGRTAEASAKLDQALKLWWGPALAGVPSAVVEGKAIRLEETRLAVYEESLALKLELRQHTDLVPELAALVREHPLRERARALLMLAQYRAGRRSEALEIFNEGRRRLVEDLGLEPGPILRDMQTAIFRDDPKLASAKPVPSVWTRVVPAQLPPTAPLFTGRQTELTALDRLLDQRARGGSLPVGVLTGQVGVGKTALAVHWARGAADHFPDGQLFADLRGWDPDHPAAEATAVLSGFLHALGVPLAEIPVRLDEQTSLYNSLVDGRRVLVVIDNVQNAAQARPLMPGSGTCCVLMTGRTLPDSHGSVRLHLKPFRTDESSALLRGIIGEERTRDDPESLERLGELCDGMPLALWSAALRLAARTHWTVKDLLSRLEDPDRRLNEISHGIWDVRAQIGASYRYLPPRAALVLRRLGSLGSCDVTPRMTATLLDCGPAEAEDLMEQLHEAGFLEVAARGQDGYRRYRLPGLFAQYARERGRTEDVGDGVKSLALVRAQFA
ncbi:AfsR/SARP family transcriptional regulator [Sphaerisporangium perillae]|uniref:AfsR/SARP family transcriptional regulator n=1 Tax=Sphaerisporangium perillae TaxID=2935860 RepID=UPI00200FBB22|nr:BTAD domain-containing putative transcriptional regulator [Sphaerisporangium perillae]